MDSSPAARDRESSVRHVVDVSEPKFGDGYFATCKCGWRSQEMATQSVGGIACPYCSAAKPSLQPYYQDDHATLYHGDCREILLGEDPRGCQIAGVWMMRGAVIVTDPPYGIAYKSGSPRATLADSIEGDEDTSLRDSILEWWGSQAALVFGTWRVPRPAETKARLIWDTKGALGMGDLSIPWKPSDQEIYVLGRGFEGHRGSNVLCYPPVQSMATNGRLHPHEKPVPLMVDLLQKCKPGVAVIDPFAGSGSTLVAAKKLGRRSLGIEIDERYCEIAASRLSQEVLDLAS